ncbi:MAG: U-box domain [Parachlamydiales bacterium]|nr:U-box domain [Parachlamydiales bacterium]
MSASSAIGASGLGSSPAHTDQKPTALEQCVARVKLAVKQVQWSHLSCSITLEAAKYPVVTNCNHLFDGAAIQEWMSQSRDPKCPLCRTDLTVVTPLEELQESDEGRLSKLLQLNEPQIATLSCLDTSLRQIQDGEIQEAINTLELCKPEILDVSSLVVGLKFQFCPSSENVELAMACALKQENPDDRIFIYQQVIAHASCRLDAYQELILLTKDPKEKRALRLQAADLARDAGKFELETSFRKEAEIPLVSTVISKDEWAAAATINLRIRLI